MNITAPTYLKKSGGVEFNILSYPHPYTVDWVMLRDCATITIGEFVHKSMQDDNAKYPVYNGGRTNTGFYQKQNEDKNQITIAARGSAGFVNRVFTDYWAGNSCYSIKVKEGINWNYLYHYIKANESTLMDKKQVGGIPAVSKKQVEELKIMLPPLPIQNEVVRILDSFDSYINDISHGLPAEIRMREQQYEYYRYKLLEF